MIDIKKLKIMKINVEKSMLHRALHLEIDTSRAKLTEEISTFSKGKYYVEGETIHDLVEAAYQCHEYNEGDALDFVTNIVDEYLDKQDKEALVEILQS